MDEHEENFKDIFRYTDVEYTPDGYTDVYRWDDFLVIAGDHVYSAMDTIDSVSPGGEYEGSTRNMPTPARSSGAAICSTAARCSVRCPTTGRTIPKSPSCAATSTIPPGSIPNVSRPGRSICPLPMPCVSTSPSILWIISAAGRSRASLVDRTEIADTFAQEIKSRLDGGKLGHGPYVDSESLRDDLTERFGFFYDIDFSGLTFKTSLILSVKSLYFEGDVVDSALDWQADYLPCVCHRGGQGENDRWEYEPTDDYRPFTRPADIPESIFDKLCASQGTTIEKVVNDPVTKFERSFREDIFNSQQNSLVGLTVLATLPLDAFLDASLSMICRGDREKAGTFTVKPGTYEPIMGIYDPINGCGGTAGIELDTDFDIDPRDIKYTMMEPRGGKWESDRIDLYTPQDCFGFSEPFAGRIEYSEKKPKIAAKAKPDPADLGRRASVAAGATVRDGVDGGGIKL